MLVCVAAIVGFLIFGKDGSKKDFGSTQLTNHTTGSDKSGVTFVEYADFQCPACSRFFPVVRQVKEKYKDRVTFQFRHFPLVEIHQNALLSARAAEAASMQGKFWEMHDLLFQNQQSWSEVTDPTPEFEKYAKQLGLDVEKFKTDLKSEAVNKAIQADRNDAKSQGFQGTPTFILNGQKLEDAQDSLEYFSQKIDEAIKSKQSQ